MKLTTPREKLASKRAYSFLAGGLAVAAAGSLMSQSAAAAAPPVSTQIKAQATATYTDGSGSVQSTKSNEVITIVQQVGAFSVSPSTGDAKSAAAGGSVSVPYTITNSGNGDDTFTISLAELAGGNAFARIDVFADVDQDGLADNTSSLLTAGALTTDGASGSTAAIAIPSGATYSFVVTYTVPSIATPPWVDTADVTVTASNTLIGYTAQSQLRTNSISLATGASFTTSGALKAPDVPPVGGGAWPNIPDGGPQGTTTTYTLTYINSGAASGSIYVEMPLTSGFTYLTGTGVWSGNGGGTALSEVAGGNGALIDFVVVGNLVRAVIPGVPVNGKGTLSFNVLANTSATIGTGSTSPTVSYSLQNCGSFTTVAQAGSNGSNCGGAGVSSVNAEPFNVTASRGVQFGGADDAVPGTPNGVADIYTAATIVAGGKARYTIPVTNSGNATEAFELSTIASGGNAFPSGTQYRWFAANGTQLLGNSNGMGGVDTGPLAAGASVNVILEVEIPSTTPVATGANYEVKALATSETTPAEMDAALARATSVLGGYIDLTTNGTNGAGPNTSVVSDSITVTAGGPGNASVAVPDTAAGNAVYALNVANNDTGSLIFNLRASPTANFPGNLPAGWAVSYHTDAAATSAAITQATVGAGSSQMVYAKVTPSGTSPSGTVDVYFQAISTTNSQLSGGIVSDSLRDQVVVQSATAYSFTLSAAGESQVTSPGSTTFAHMLINSGAATCGDPANGLSFVATLDAASAAAGWTTALYLDTGSIGQLDGETPITDGKVAAFAPGANVPVLVRVHAPAGAVLGSASNIVVTVKDLKTGQNCGEQSVDDVVRVVTGQMEVLKTQMVDASCANSGEPSSGATMPVKPGQCVIYKVVAKNIGAVAASGVALLDYVPNYTTLATNQPAVTCAATGATGSPALIVAGTQLTCGTATLLQPNGTMTMRYAVQVNN